MRLNQEIHIKTPYSTTNLFNYTDFEVRAKETQLLVDYYELIAGWGKNYPYGSSSLGLQRKRQTNHMVFIAPPSAPNPSWAKIDVGTNYGAENPHPTTSFIKTTGAVPSEPTILDSKVVSVNRALAVELCQALVEVDDQDGTPNFHLQEQFANSVGSLYVMKKAWGVEGRGFTSYELVKRFVLNSGWFTDYKQKAYKEAMLYKDLFDAIPRGPLPIGIKTHS